MSVSEEILEHIKHFGIAGCHVRRRDIIAFSAQKWTDDDPLVPRETMLFFYYPDDPKEDQWAASQIDNVTGVYGSACFKPYERWVFVSESGEVYVVGDGDDDYEKPIDSSKLKHFSSVKCINHGFAYAVGIGRDVYKRTNASKWVKLSDGIINLESSMDLDCFGFDDIDGFSENEIYACGRSGDLWRYNGNTWTQEDIPTNSNLEKILCASNGLVYITTDKSEIIIGRDSFWQVIEQEPSDADYSNIIEYNSIILVSTENAVFQINGQHLIATTLAIPKMNSYAHMAAGDGILVIAGYNEAQMYDGVKWSKIF